MKIKTIVGSLFGCLLCSIAFGEPDTEIRYSLTDLGSNQWEYAYTVENIGLSEGIEEFSIWFDCGLYNNLVVTTPAPLSDNWDEVAIQPEPVLSDDGYYDALAETGNPGISIGVTVSDFSVSFDWLGMGTPGSQFYEIIDPDTFATIEDGYTVPEPITLILLGGGLFALRTKKT